MQKRVEVDGWEERNGSGGGLVLGKRERNGRNISVPSGVIKFHERLSISVVFKAKVSDSCYKNASASGGLRPSSP